MPLRGSNPSSAFLPPGTVLLGKQRVGAGTELCRQRVQKNRLGLGPGPEWQEVIKNHNDSEPFAKARPCTKCCMSHEFDVILTTILALITEKETEA